ncbi:MAG TPA: sigma-54 dependent transcriptional regulator [Thermoanaerobaculia bacterium]|nr:sigma-54 dependent transcriptional regulator [Thermoanaerobaculia bacterium]
MADAPNRILIVDDAPDIRVGLAALLESEGWETRTAENVKQGIVAFGEFSPDVVLLDVALPDGSGIDLLDQIKRYSEHTPVIMMSGAGTFDTVVEAMKLGAETFLAKPFEFAMLQASLGQAMKIVRQRSEIEVLRRQASRGEGERLYGVSPAIVKLNETIVSIASASVPVLIEGESGTGKGLVARLIHLRSPRARGPFVDLNCAGLSRELLESELFGHEKGSFTGATAAKPGLFEVAASGTVFLDEIGEMDPTIQARLLKAIEDKRFRRVGGVRDLRSDFRLIAATNRNLADEIKAGRFRSDLYYRLNVVRLTLPPLRERTEDIPVLASMILDNVAKDIGRNRPPKLSERALAKLASYGWPGNVRELRNVLERAVLIAGGNEIRADDIHLGEVQIRTEDADRPLAEWEVQPLDEVEARYVKRAVDAVGGNIRKAARLLKVSPSTVYAKLGGAQK